MLVSTINQVGKMNTLKDIANAMEETRIKNPLGTYTSYKELKGNQLKVGNKLVFGKIDGITYKVRNSYFYNENPKEDNEEIFEILGVIKKDFCDKQYGYPSRGGNWPCYIIGDYEAATRIALKIFSIIENTNEQTN